MIPRNGVINILQSKQMTTLESNIVSHMTSAKKIFSFLADLNHFEALMPEQVSDWQSTAKEASFNINGMATLSMCIKEELPYSKLVYRSQGENPFEYSLICNIEELTPETVTTKLSFEADLNPMLKMMLVKPLTNLLNILNDKLAQQVMDE